MVKFLPVKFKASTALDGSVSLLSFRSLPARKVPLFVTLSAPANSLLKLSWFIPTLLLNVTT